MKKILALVLATTLVATCSGTAIYAEEILDQYQGCLTNEEAKTIQTENFEKMMDVEVVDQSEIEETYKADTDYDEIEQKEFVEEFDDRIRDYGIDEDNIKIEFISEDTISEDDQFVVVETVDDAIDYLDKVEEYLNESSGQNCSVSNLSLAGYRNKYSSNSSILKTAGRNLNVYRGFTRGALNLRINLFANINYNTHKGAINSVTGRSLTFTGVTTSAPTNRKYRTTFNSSKTVCTVVCNYTHVSRLWIPGAGYVEVSRRDAYQKFNWSAAKGVYGGAGGFGRY